MIPDNVTLVVKAPNQQIEDQNIDCQSSWTVRQLKGYLSEVYPSKPSTDEQKIIYSGQLLDDNAIIKDVLRTYEYQMNHIMHLVCTPKRRMPEVKPVEQKISPPEINNDGLRQRNVTNTVTPEPTPPLENVSRPETRQNDQNHTVEMQNFISSFVNNYGRIPPYPTNYNLGEGHLPMTNDPAMIANHMMMMQQAYMQYMQQYANMWQNQQQPLVQEPPTPVAAPAPPPAPAEEEENGAADWLDQIYAASRVAVLLSLVYFYGSATRLLLVLLLAAAGYLHQIGFFRDLNVNPANANNQRRNEAPPPVQQPNQNPPTEAPPREGEGADARSSDADARVLEHPTSLLASSWMIFTSFFASLMPETN